MGDEGRAGFTREVSSAVKREEHQNDAKEISADTAVAPVYQTKVVFKKRKHFKEITKGFLLAGKICVSFTSATNTVEYCSLSLLGKQPDLLLTVKII